ncbi:hypothetical protein CPB84DRAFT_1793524 [Gymnopilus junonius]|uniref:Uncharacterized protein n=1 Tax=Gymnopilus junonius TaxID=109634 RepID=A0A9P5THR9_GYMJU|nr:hypothetical protein CPB84DRAFT_1793524 [Gymnopilus junonius]
MSLKGVFKFALLTAHVLIGMAGPLEIRSSEELVHTPAGFIPKSNVHAVPKGARVHQSATEVHIIAANGTVLHSAPYTGSNSKPVGQIQRATTSTRRDLQSGYIAYAYWNNAGASPISFFNTNWIVPPTPSSLDSQLVYWFNGLIPQALGWILQPVLQYGVSPAGGGEFYAIASWWLVGNNAYHTDVIPVSSGTFLQGQMSLTGTSTSGGEMTYDYESTFVGYPDTTISATNTTELTWAYEALEMYNAESISDLPSGNTMFSSIDISFQDGQHPPSISWNVASDSMDGITMTVLSDSATTGSLLLTY